MTITYYHLTKREALWSIGSFISIANGWLCSLKGNVWFGSSNGKGRRNFLPQGLNTETPAGLWNRCEIASEIPCSVGWGLPAGPRFGWSIGFEMLMFDDCYCYDYFEWSTWNIKQLFKRMRSGAEVGISEYLHSNLVNQGLVQILRIMCRIDGGSWRFFSFHPHTCSKCSNQRRHFFLFFACRTMVWQCFCGDNIYLGTDCTSIKEDFQDISYVMGRP